MKHSPIVILWFAIFLMFVFAVSAGQASELTDGINISQTDAPSLRMARACEAGEQVTVSFVGDILPQSGLSEQSYASPIGFESLWKKVRPWIEASDVAYGNLEGPAARGVARNGLLKADPGLTLDGDVYWATDLQFNYHPRIVDDLKRSGFDILSVSNNHSLDRGSLGVDNTLEAFTQAGLASVGARASHDKRPVEAVKTQANGFNIAWISCTESLNGNRDRYKQFLNCVSDEAVINSEIRKLSTNPSVDAVVVTPHWGVEYKHIEASFQRRLSRSYLDAGASAVVGSHPHVMQPVESYRTRDGRETVIAYSLGNFVSNQGKRIGQKISVVLYLGFTKRSGEKAWINGVSYIPLWMERGPHSVNLLDQSKQVDRTRVEKILGRLVDSSRKLRVGDKVRANLECH